MKPEGLLFVVALQACFIGLLVSQAKPHWFRVNGKTPSRWKIGAMWGALAVACALGAVAQSNTPDTATTDVLETATERVIQPDEAMSDSPLDPIDSQSPAQAVEIPSNDSAIDAARPIEDGAMDAARPIEDTALPADRQPAKSKAGARRE